MAKSFCKKVDFSALNRGSVPGICPVFAILAPVMMVKTRGVVLHTIRYSDKSLIAEVFTEQYGALSFLVRVANQRKSVMKNVLLSPLTLLEIDFDYRERVRLQRLTEVRVAEPYTSLPYHPLKQTIALFLGEFLFHALRDEGPNAPLYAFLHHSLLWLDAASQGFVNFPVALLLRLSRFLGIWPTEEEARTMVRPEDVVYVPLLLRMDFSNMHLYRFTREQKTRLMDVLNTYYRRHVADFPELRSMAILREVLS